MLGLKQTVSRRRWRTWTRFSGVPSAASPQDEDAALLGDFPSLDEEPSEADLLALEESYVEPSAVEETPWPEHTRGLLLGERSTLFAWRN